MVLTEQGREGQANTEVNNLDILAIDDVRMSIAVGTGDVDLRVGTIPNTQSDEWPYSTRRDAYYFTRIYNPTNAVKTVVYELIGYSANFTAYIEAGKYFEARGCIKTILASGTDSFTAEVSGKARGTVTGDGPRRLA